MTDIIYYHFTAEELGDEMFVAAANNGYDGIDTVAITRCGENELYFWTFVIAGDVSEISDRDKFIDYLELWDDFGYSCGSFESLEDLAEQYVKEIGEDGVFYYLLEKIEEEI